MTSKQCTKYILSCSQENPTKRLGENIRRIFQERGIDFFDRNGGHILENGKLLAGEPENKQEQDGASDEPPSTDTDGDKPMTSEELMKLRMEIIPQLLCVILAELELLSD
jgi:mediator of RNA polymerase II transcription subunit 17, fungi type